MKFVKTTVSSKTFGADKEFSTVTYYLQEELMWMNRFDSLLVNLLAPKVPLEKQKDYFAHKIINHKSAQDRVEKQNENSEYKKVVNHKSAQDRVDDWDFLPTAGR